MRRGSIRLHELRKKARKGFRGFPVATLAYYGPDNSRASKVAVGIISREGAEPVLTRYFSEQEDVRNDPAIAYQILDLLKNHGVKSVAATDGLLGCPHEEGIDYPEGESCPKCPYWAGRDRFTKERIH